LLSKSIKRALYTRDLYHTKGANKRDPYQSKEPYKRVRKNDQANVLGIAVAVHVSIKKALYTRDLYQTKGAYNRDPYRSKEPYKRALQK